MIYDSRSWKRQLKRYARKLRLRRRFKIPSPLLNSFRNSIDKIILYSAVITRKLIESNKLSDSIDQYEFNVFCHKPRRNVDRLHRWVEDGDYEWDPTKKVSVLGKKLCNALIHSYVYSIYFDNNHYLDGFFVSSDYDRNKILYQVNLADWIDYITLVSEDDIIDAEFIFDIKKNDFVSQKKYGAPFSNTNYQGKI